MACSFNNKCAKNVCKQTVLVQLIVEDVVTCFCNTVYIAWEVTYERIYLLSDSYGSVNLLTPC